MFAWNRRPLLTARWTDLLVATYAVPDRLVAPRLPAGVELDRWNGSAHVSLVGFDFKDARPFGVPSPLYRNFAEWNVRAYVTHRGRRGVLFLREFVSHPLLTLAARAAYREPFVTAEVTSAHEAAGGRRATAYTLRHGGRTHALRATATDRLDRIAPGTAEDRFLNQSWAFGSNRRGVATAFRIERPEWKAYRPTGFAADLDWSAMLDPTWGEMNDRAPVSSALVDGSGVDVFAPQVVAEPGRRPVDSTVCPPRSARPRSSTATAC